MRTERVFAVNKEWQMEREAVDVESAFNMHIMSCGKCVCMCVYHTYTHVSMCMDRKTVMMGNRTAEDVFGSGHVSVTL